MNSLLADIPRKLRHQESGLPGVWGLSKLRKAQTTTFVCVCEVLGIFKIEQGCQCSLVLECLHSMYKTLKSKQINSLINLNLNFKSEPMLKDS
jgi:hypothetical protein